MEKGELSTLPTSSSGVSIKLLKSNRSHFDAALTFKFPHKFYPFIKTLVQKPNNRYEQPAFSNIRVDKCDLKFNLPYPVNLVKEPCENLDPCWELVKLKEVYDKRINYCRGQYNKYHKKTITTKLIKNEDTKYVELPKYLIDLASQSTLDPDPYFDENYDYYYTGGNVSKIKKGGEVYVAAPTTDNNLYIINERNELNYNLPNMKTEKIYGINGYKEKMLVRQKMHISCYDFLDDNLHLLYEIKSEDIPFICCNVYKKQQLGYLDVHSNLRIDNMETQQTILEYSFPRDEEKASLVQFAFKKNDIVFSKSDSLEFLDRRSMDIRSHSLVSGFFDCNGIRTFCVDGDYIYILTKHNVVKFDMRQMMVVKKWTHFLTLPPISIRKQGDNLFFNTFDEVMCVTDIEHFNYMPIRLPLIKQTYEKRNLHHYPIFDLDLQKRFELSVTGIDAHNNTIFIRNSIGDMYMTEYGNELTANDDDSIRKLNEMLNTMPKNNKPLQVTSFRNLKSIKSIFNSETKWKSLRKMQKSNNKKIKKFLESGHDFEKHDMAKIWDEDKVTFINSDSDEEMGESKVTNWLQSASKFNDSIEID